MEVKKNNTGLIWLVVILLILVLCLIGYIIFDKTLYKVTTNNEKTTTTKNEKEENNTLRRDNFIYDLNNKKIHISYVYRKMNSSEFVLWKENSNNDEIKNANDIYNMIYLEILLNEKKLELEKIPLYYNYESDEDLLNQIHFLSSDTINTLRGSDLEYLVFTIEHAHPYVDGGVNPFIVNGEGNVIHSIVFQDNTGWWTTDESSIMHNKGEYYLTDDTLYYLMPNCERTNDSGLYFDQYLLNVSDNKVIIEKQDTYKGEAAGGAVCGG